MIGILLSLVPKQLSAGLRWIEVGINGMTCSACSRSVDMSISHLEFVDSVEMSLEKTTARVFVKGGKPINFKAIVEAVKDAGFSVDFVKLDFDFNDVSPDQEGNFTFQGQRFQCLQFSGSNDLKEIVLKLVDDGFLPRGESNQWKKKIKPAGIGVRTIHVVQEI